METIPKKRLFSRKEYYQMAETGILTCTDKTELIRGEILIKSPSGAYHSSRIRKIDRLFSQYVGDKAQTSVQSPVRLNDLSEPEPDFALLHFREDDYPHAHPGPEDILLLIEVSHSTYSFDKQVKIPLYAQAGIPEVWILNLNTDQVEVFKRPVKGVYQEESVLQPGQEIGFEALGCTIAVGDLVGS
ncbi:MAG: Uma2 family endonuclease [Bacteroidota bacterium]